MTKSFGALANPSPGLIQELRRVRSKYADDTDDISKEALGRFAEKWRRDGARRQTRPAERNQSLAY